MKKGASYFLETQKESAYSLLIFKTRQHRERHS